MEPMTTYLVVSAVSSIVSGYMGMEGNEKAAAEKKALMDRLFAEIDALELPSIKSQELKLKELRRVGILTPKLEKKILMDPSAFEGIGVPQELIDSQHKALRGIEEIYENDGLTAADKFRLAQTSMKAATEERGRREAIFQNMRQRGLGGSGMELAANMMAQQQGAQRRSMEGLGVEALAQERALEALKDAGMLSSGMRDQTMNEQFRTAEGLDAMARFNNESAQNLENRNTNRTNDAKLFNLAEDQRIADTNVGIKNQEQITNKALIQQNFNNELAKLGIKQGVTINTTDAITENAKANAEMWSNLGSGVSKAATAYALHGTDAEDEEELDLFDSVQLSGKK